MIAEANCSPVFLTMNPLTRHVGMSLLHHIILQLLHAPLTIYYSRAKQWSNNGMGEQLNGAMQWSSDATIQRIGMVEVRSSRSVHVDDGAVEVPAIEVGVAVVVEL